MSTSDRIGIFEDANVEQLRRQRKLDPEHIRRLRNASLKKFLPDAEALAPFPVGERIRLHALSEHQRLDSAVDGASKLLLRTDAGLLTETVVLRIASGRCSLCVSSQVGCAAACRFCATGSMGIARDLTSAEILDQVQRGGQLLAAEGRRLGNVVFMGMGEPLHNEAHVHDAVARLCDPAYFDLPASKIMVSTVGLVEPMLRFGRRFPDVGLALSLHSARQTQRGRLIPLAKHNPLPSLRRAIVELNRVQSRPVMLEYLLLDGVTDTAADLEALLRWTDNLGVHINLIPYNPTDVAPELVGSTATAAAAFEAGLKAAGRRTTVRYSLGRDIEAACGQLVRRQSLTKRSAPNGALGSRAND